VSPEALLDLALEATRAAGARFAEVRLVSRRRERLTFRDAALDGAVDERDRGLGIRALVGGGWGYAGTHRLDAAGVRAAAEAAVRAAGATRSAAPVVLPPAVTGRYATPVGEDPFAVPIGEKLALVGAADTAMRASAAVQRAGSAFKGSRAELSALRTETRFRTSHGTDLEQSVTLCGAKLAAIAASETDFQVRSYPKSFEGNVLQAGFEVVRALDLPGRAPLLADEALALLDAEVVPAGRRTLILDGSQLSLQIHESVGHPTELDRAFGEEISLAGASFLLPERLDALRFGADRVNLVADATTPLGPGTFGFDDEGTPATSTPLVRDGLFVGYLSGRDAAARLGRPSASALRAESWYGLPIVRMTNVNLLPGAGTLDDLIGGVDDGLLLSANKSWSIDDLRLNFQFACEIAYEIKGGRRTGRLFKNPVYWGRSPEFWGNCTAIAGPEAWEMWGWLFCGKGDPVQIMHVGHGCAPARFDDVSFGARS
jgi:TldD protein